MPKRTKSLPKYRRHKATGQAVVTLDGKDFYLGRHGTKASKAEYDWLVGEWAQNGRRLPTSCNDTTITELAAAYWQFAETYYVKNGRATDEQPCIRSALRHLTESYGRTLAADFRPLSLKAVRQKMIDAGNSRGYINSNVARLKRAFRWGAENEIVPAAVYQALAIVSGLHKGKTDARETNPILPVDEAAVDATVAEMPKSMADLVRFQKLTGCRPCEVYMIRPCDIDRNGDVWSYRPESHKTEHLDDVDGEHIGKKAFPRGRRKKRRPARCRPGRDARSFDVRACKSQTARKLDVGRILGHPARLVPRLPGSTLGTRNKLASRLAQYERSSNYSPCAAKQLLRP